MLAYMFCDSKACTKTLDYTMMKKKNANSGKNSNYRLI